MCEKKEGNDGLRDFRENNDDTSSFKYWENRKFCENILEIYGKRKKQKRLIN
jgi:hypothetical protein